MAVVLGAAGVASLPVDADAAQPNKPGKPGNTTYELLPTAEKPTQRGPGRLSWSKPAGAPVFPVEAASDGSSAGLVAPKPVDGAQADGGGVQALAAWPAPDFNYAVDGCIDSTRTVCRNRDTHRVYWKDLWVAQGSEIEVATSDMQGVGGSSPDTMIYILSCSPSCEDGTILAIDDDGNTLTADQGWDSRVSATAPTSGTLRVLVIGYSKDRHGTADIEIKVDQTQVLFDNDRMFGGWSMNNKEVRRGDRVWVGKDTDDSASNGLPGWPQYHDAMLWVLGNTARDCDSGTCGRFVHSDDVHYGNTSVLLPWLEIPSSMGTSSYAKVLVGVWGSSATDTCPSSLCPVPIGQPEPRWKMNARLFHLRRSLGQGGEWSTAGSTDFDGDGLNREIEQQLGTCDEDDDPSFWGVGVRGYDCNTYKNLVDTRLATLSTALGGNPLGCGGSGEPPCWTPKDSDNDGLDDGSEVWVSAWSCSQVPTAPYFDGGTCTPIGLHAGSGCPGAWCSVMPLSAMTDPDPVVYDIFVEERSWVCGVVKAAWGDPGWCIHPDRHNLANGADTDHGPTAAQLSGLEEVFSVWPFVCWDGSSPSGSPPTCRDTFGGTIAADRPYMMHLHLVETDHLLADDTTGAEVPFSGNEMAGTYMSAMLGLTAIDGMAVGPLRYAGLGRFLLTTHYDGGQAPGQAALFEGTREERLATLPGRVAVAGNDLPSGSGALGRIRSATAHELGHSLGLQHPHEAGHAWTNASNPTLDFCATCGGGPVQYCGAFNCANTGWINPLQNSLMSYYFARSLPLGAGAPSLDANGTQSPNVLCNSASTHFSKGLGVTVSEGTLFDAVGALPTSPPRWQQEQTAIDATCYNAPWDLPCGNTSPQWSAFAWDTQVGSTRLRDQAPYCDGAGCYVNWADAIQASPGTGSYASNLSWSDQLGLSSSAPVCREDQLAPYDEYLLMMTLGKRSLRPHGAAGATLERNFAVYLDGFNGKEISNIAGWPVQVVSGSPVGIGDSLPVNGCTEANEASDCSASLGVQECLTDVCSNNDECRNGTCSSGTCACADDTDCWSRRCNLDTGRCLTGFGTCSCSDGYDNCLGSTGVCQEPTAGAPNSRYCKTTEPSETWTFEPIGSTYRSQFRHLAFDYGAGAQAIELNIDALSTLSDGYHGSFRVFIDIRLDAFASGQSTATLLRSGAFELSATSSGGGFQLTVTASNGVAVTLGQTGAGSGTTLQLGRWYRVAFGYKNAANIGLFLAAQAWDLSGGRFELNGGGMPNWQCSRETSGLLPLTVGDNKLELGGRVSSPTTRMRGGIDNVAIYNFVGDPAQYPTPLTLNNCVEVL
jgi:hypothetical protein